MAKHQFSDEELALLSDEEREGLEDDELVDDPADAEDDESAGEDDAGEEDDAAAADEADETDENEEAGEDPDGDPLDDDGEDEAKAGDPPPAVAEEETTRLVVDAPPLVPIIPKFEPVEDYDGKKADIGRREEELEAKYDDGQVDTAEYRRTLRALNDERLQLETAKTKADITQEAGLAYRRQAETDWGQRVVPAWMERHPAIANDQDVLTAFDLEVRALQTTARNDLDPALLDKALANLNAKAAKLAGALSGTQASPAAKKDQSGSDRRGKQRDLPPSLKDLPSAGAPDAEEDGLFAALDRLADKDTLAFEKRLGALEKTDPARYAEYMAR